MNSYKQLLADIWQNGDWRTTRSGDTCAVFGRSIAWDLAKGFPAVTTKKLMWDKVVGELLWFLSGNTDLPSLRKFSSQPEGSWTIWSDDCERWHSSGEKINKGEIGSTYVVPKDNCGKIYGHQWRKGIHGDQIAKLIKGLKEDPYSRYHIVLSYNPSEAAEMCLPACHTMFQCFVRNDDNGKPCWLDLRWDQRSIDSFLGFPYNLASYALLTHILAKLTGLIPGKLICNLGDTHIYNVHTEALMELMENKPYALPKVVIPNFTEFEQVLKCTSKAFVLKNYKNYGFIKAPLSVGA